MMKHFTLLLIYLAPTMAAANPEGFESWWKSRQDEKILCNKKSQKFKPDFYRYVIALPEGNNTDIRVSDPGFIVKTVKKIKQHKGSEILLITPDFIYAEESKKDGSYYTRESIKCESVPSKLYSADSSNSIDLPYSTNPDCKGLTTEGEVYIATYPIDSILYIELIANHPAGIPNDLYKYEYGRFQHVYGFLSGGCPIDE